MTDYSDDAKDIAAGIEAFVRDIVVPYESDPRGKGPGPAKGLVDELRDKARDAGLTTPHIRGDGTHLSHLETALMFRKCGLSPLGPLGCRIAAPDEGNMDLLGKVGSPDIKRRFLDPLVSGNARSAFFITEPADENGEGSDPSLIKTTCRRDGNHWIVNGRKAFITSADGAKIGITNPKSEEAASNGGACVFLVDLPDSAVRIERILDTIDSSMPGGHAVVAISDLCVSADQMLGEPGEVIKQPR